MAVFSVIAIVAGLIVFIKIAVAGHWIIGLVVGFFVLGLIGAAGEKISEWFD